MMWRLGAETPGQLLSQWMVLWLVGEVAAMSLLVQRCRSRSGGAGVVYASGWQGGVSPGFGTVSMLWRCPLMSRFGVEVRSSGVVAVGVGRLGQAEAEQNVKL